MREGNFNLAISIKYGRINQARIAVVINNQITAPEIPVEKLWFFFHDEVWKFVIEPTKFFNDIGREFSLVKRHGHLRF